MSGETLLANLVEFGRVLRGAGLPVTVGQLSNVTQALGWIDVGDREQVFLTCRALLVARREDLPLFEILFHRFFGWPDQAASHQPQPAPLAPRHDPARQPRFTIVNFMAFKARQDGPEIDIGDRAGRYTDIEVLRSRRFAEMTPEELEAVKRLIEHLSWDVALRISRRHRRDRTVRRLSARAQGGRPARRAAAAIAAAGADREGAARRDARGYQRIDGEVLAARASALSQRGSCTASSRDVRIRDLHVANHAGAPAQEHRSRPRRGDPRGERLVRWNADRRVPP